jgi:hypothetical protein
MILPIGAVNEVSGVGEDLGMGEEHASPRGTAGRSVHAASAIISGAARNLPWDSKARPG